MLEQVKKSYNIYKDPVTDDGTKKSLKGLLCVVESDYPIKEIEVIQECTPEVENQGLLQVIYEDGKFYNQTTLTEIRTRLINS
jgi:nicotinamide phosphoribosyltransferase